MKRLFKKISKKENLIGTSQDNDRSTYSIWRDDKDYKINWEMTSEQILHHINSRTSLIATAITNVSNLIVEAVVLLSLSIYFLLKIGSTSFYILGILFFISFLLFPNFLYKW